MGDSSKILVTNLPWKEDATRQGWRYWLKSFIPLHSNRGVRIIEKCDRRGVGKWCFKNILFGQQFSMNRQRIKIKRQLMRGRSYVLWRKMKRKNTPFFLKWPGFFLCDKLISVQPIEAPTGRVYYMNLMGV
jgi:hypothetical protein